MDPVPSSTKDTSSHVPASDDYPPFASTVGMQTAVLTRRSIEMAESSRQNFASSVVPFDGDVGPNKEIMHLIDVEEEAFT